jgi:8-oxo-dGTP pyrophosphatase MutT (NUDIX family)
MEPGETEEQTAHREMKEETSLDGELVPGKYTELSYDIPPYTRKQVVLFLGAADGTVKCQKSEIAEYKWVAAHELQKYLHPETCKACAKLLE